MMRWIKAWAFGLAASAILVGCGGGGGETGSCTFSCPGGGTDVTYAVAVDVQRGGTSVESVSSTETVQAVARVVDESNKGVEGVLVTFSESGASLLKFAPTAATALTDSDGYASLDISAISTASAGATTVEASASVGGTSYDAEKSISISASGEDEVAEPSAINFVSVVPAGQAIVIKGAGGNGRSESATLTFKVVDENNAPIKGATVAFAVNPVDKVTLNIAESISDLDGLVTTTVHSGTEPTSVVVTATAMTSDNVAVTGQSDTLVISNGVAMEGGFEIVAETYNLDGHVTGETTAVSAFVRDANGNPVPDGLAVSFTTDFGGVASSDLGGCLTVNGTCDVDFRVQDPRGEGLATVIATVNVGSGTTLSDSIEINMAMGPYVAVDVGTTTPTGSFSMSSCKETFLLDLLDASSGRSVAAGTVISVAASTSDVSASISSGTPVLDSPSFTPTSFTVEIDATSTALTPACNPNGTLTRHGFIQLQYVTPRGTTYPQFFALYYPS